MRKTILYLCLAIIFSVIEVRTGEAHPAQTSTVTGISYTITMNEPSKHIFHVSLMLSEVPAENFELKMPIWMQAIYEIQNYGEQVQNLTASAGDEATVKVSPTNDHTWLVSLSRKVSVTIGYDLDVSTSHKLFGKSYLDKQSAIIHGGSFFLYNPLLRKKAINLKIILPENWSAATALADENNSAGKNSTNYRAQDYDELTDSPIMLGKFKRLDFTVSQIPFSIVVDARLKHSAEDLKESAEKIARSEIDFFGSAPFDRYLFFYFATNDTAGNGMKSPMVGVEHQKSTLITVDPAVESFAGSNQIYREVTAHELFHAWNVKAIRPQGLSYPDLDAAPVVRSLWLLEGFTQYYTQKILFQLFGNGKYDSFYQQVSQGLFQAQLPASLQVISLNAPVESVNDFELLYTKGAVAGLLLDLKIHQSTHNAKGLDDFMRVLWQRYGRQHHPYDEDKLGAVLDETAPAGDLMQFYRKYIIGSRGLPINEYLAIAGWEMKGQSVKSPFLGISLLQKNRQIVDFDPEGNGARAGLQLQDILIAVDGKPLDDSSDLNKLMVKLKDSDKFKLTIMRGNQQLDVQIKAVVKLISQPSITETSKASEEQIAFRKAVSTPSTAVVNR